MNQNPTHRESVDPDIDLTSTEQAAEVWRHPGTLPAIILGGMIGASARHGLEILWPVMTGGFPWATFVTNISGSLLLGVLMVVVLETSAAHPLLRPFVGVGIIGGYTTFSTYAVQARTLLAGSDPHPATAIAYLFGTLLAALAAVALGLTLGRLAAHRNWRRPAREAS